MCEETVSRRPAYDVSVMFESDFQRRLYTAQAFCYNKIIL